MTDYLTHLRSIPVIGMPARYWEEEEDRRATVTCVHCGDVWHPEFEQPFTQWSAFHAGCSVAPCDHCGQPTNTPDACFDCYHAPFGIGWAEERERAFAEGGMAWM